MRFASIRRVRRAHPMRFYHDAGVGAHGAPYSDMMTSNGRQNGYILMQVIIAIAVVASIAFMLNNQSALNIDETAGVLEAEQAEQVTQAGLQHAVWANNNSGCAGDMALTTVPFGQAGTDSYTSTVTTPGGSTTAYANLAVDQDAWFRSDDVTKNNGTTADMHLRMEAGNLEYALYRFDLSSLPAGSQINSASAWLYVTSSGPGGGAFPEGPLTVHRVAADWTETGATWDTMNTNFDSAVIATIPAQPQDDVWVQVNLTAQVQAWVNGGEANYGIMLIPTGEGTYGKLVSREGAANQQPRLDVIVGTGPATPATITATGTLTGYPSPANDISRTLTHNAVPVYQPASEFVLQPGPEGKDGWVDATNKSNNFGTTTEMVITGGANPKHFLIEFKLPAIPYGSRIVSARLEMELNYAGSSTAAAEFSVYRMTQAWTEGTGDYWNPGDGANWNTSDGSTAWNWTSNHNASAVAITRINPTFDGRHSWEIKSLVQQWVSGQQPNYGLLIKGNANAVGAGFASSDWSTASKHPSLTITYACECGSACLAPQGSGKVLLVVGNDTSPDPEDVYKQSLMEAWGYTVQMINDGANQAAYDTGISSHDVIYVSETIDATTLGSKLGNPGIGIVNEEGWKNDDFGFESANSSNWPVGDSITITDTSHYITAPFASGSLTIYNADMGGLAIDNTPAPDLQSLADWGTDSGLAVLETGAMTSFGSPAAGRRVMLPFGRDTLMDWPHVNSNGRLIMQRALQWGTGNTGATPARHLLFVAASLTPTVQEQLRIDLIESWGYSVNLIDDGDSQANFDAAIAANDVAYVSSLATETALGTKLTAANIGVVNEQGALVDEFGFGLQSVIYKSRIEIDVLDNTHYITQPFPTGLITLFTGNQTLHLMTANKGPGFVALGQVFNTGSFYDDSLGVIETGGELYGGGTAAGRRVLLPWGIATFDVASLNSDGLAIMQRAIEWAEGAGSVPAPGLNVLLVVGDATTLSSKDVSYKALIESWGHTVTLIDDDDSQANYDTAMAAADVILASGSALGASMLDKATNTTKGLVNEVNGKIDNFGFSSSTSSTANFDTFSITNPGHYITEPFASNPVTVFTSSLTNPVPAGTLAPDLQKVGFDGSTLVLGTLDTGATRYDSNPSPGRRVHLPYASAETTDMTADGKTILQRALEWAAGAVSGGGGGGTVPNAHWKLDDVSGLTAVDSVGGHDGTLINGLTWTTGQLDGALQFNGTNDYINVPHADTLSLTTFSISAWIRPDTVSGIHAIVYKGASTSEANYHLYTDADEITLGLTSGGWQYQITTASANLVAGQWYHLTTTFDGASGEGKHYLDGSLIHTGTIGPSPIMNTGPITIGTDPFDEFWDGLLDDVRIYDSVLAASEINDLYAVGSGGGGGGPLPPDSCDGTFRDEFNLRQYDQNDGTLTWATVWQETGETPTSPTGGDIFIANDTSNYQLRLQDDGQTIMREVDLGTAVSATLSFDYRREGLSGSNDYVAVEVSYNGGSSWSELGRFIGTATDPSYLNTSYVLDAGSLSANTRIRFKTPSNGMKDNNGAWFDNIQIQCTP